MGRWGSRLSRGPPALRWEGLVAFQKRGPPLVVSKPPVLLELIKPRRRWSRLSDAQGLRCQESTLLVPVNSWAPAEFAGWARLLSSSLHCAPDRGRQGGKETQDRASWCASWPACGGGGRLRPSSAHGSVGRAGTQTGSLAHYSLHIVNKRSESSQELATLPPLSRVFRGPHLFFCVPSKSIKATRKC